jgi:hypothetical protein
MEADMKITFAAQSPNEIEFTLKITMPMKDWCALRDQLPEKWPSSRISLAVNRVITESQNVFYAPEQDAL